MFDQISTWLVRKLTQASGQLIDRERAQLERLQSELITCDPDGLPQVFDEDGWLAQKEAGDETGK